MLCGQFRHLLDSKHRTVIPSRLKRELKGQVVFYLKVSKRKKELLVYSAEKAKALSPAKMKFCTIVNSDVHGRIIVPSEIAKTLFSGCTTILWEGWGEYCKILPDKR